jgi:hypothetical protein
MGYDGYDDCDGDDFDPRDFHGFDPGDFDDGGPIDGVGFADPGGRSALRAATRSNPRDRPCPTCGAEDVLTRADVARGYQCNRCADRDEGRMGGEY